MGSRNKTRLDVWRQVSVPGTCVITACKRKRVVEERGGTKVEASDEQGWELRDGDEKDDDLGKKGRMG